MRGSVLILTWSLYQTCLLVLVSLFIESHISIYCFCLRFVLYQLAIQQGSRVVCTVQSYETVFYNVICDFTTCIGGSIYE